MEACFRSLPAIAGVNLKHNLLPHFLLALGIAFLTPALFGIASLNPAEAAQPLEMLLSLSGTVLCAPVFLPEQNENIRDLIRSKRTDYLTVCAVRLVCCVLFLAVLLGGFTLVMYCSESEVSFGHFAGGFASALFLGGLGFFFAGVSGNVIAGYMISMIYYILNFAVKDRLGNFYLFSMCSGSFKEKYWLLGGAAVLFALTFAALKRKR